jgi:uncharacterized protein (TIGR02611 family)
MTDRPKRGWIAQTRRVFILLAGVTILAIGALLLILPGPGTLIILAGLALLALEFEWANGTLNSLKARLGKKPVSPPTDRDETLHE